MGSLLVSVIGAVIVVTLAVSGNLLVAVIVALVFGIVAIRMSTQVTRRDMATAIRRAPTSPIVPPTPPAPSTGPMELLGQLAGLRDQGAITTEEYEAKKRELLDRL